MGFLLVPHLQMLVAWERKTAFENRQTDTTQFTYRFTFAHVHWAISAAGEVTTADEIDRDT